MPNDETRNSVKDKFAKRFDNEGETDTSSSKPSSSQSPSADAERSINVRDDWQNHSVYLDDNLSGALSTLYKKLDWQLDEEYDFPIKKTRHYYPLVIQLGLEQLEQMETEEAKEKIEELEHKDI